MVDFIVTFLSGFILGFVVIIIYGLYLANKLKVKKMEMFNKMFSEYIPREERMHEITHKLKKYEKKVEGEPLNQKRLMKEWRQNQKRRYTDVVLSRLNMKGSQKEEAHYLIQKFNFKDLCRRCSMEQIITAICVYIKLNIQPKNPTL